MELIAAPVLVLAAAFFDRQRGSPEIAEYMPKWLALLGLGLVIATTILPPEPYQAALLVAGTWAAYSIGFGHPLGWAITGEPLGPYEPWQVGVLRRNPWLALAVRGAMHAAPGLLIGDLYAAGALAIGFALAFPLAPYLATRLCGARNEKAWALNEYFRGGLAVAFLVAAYA